MHFLVPAITLVLMVVPLTSDAARVELVAGGGTRDANGPATECRLREPFGTEFRPDGTMVIVEMVTGNRLLRVDHTRRLTVIAGMGTKGFSGDGGPATAAQMNGVHNLAVAPNGDIYLSDAWNFRVRRIDGKTGIITTFAGTGKKGFSGDGGPASVADFSTVIQVSLDPAARHLFVADIDNRRIRRITLAGGIVETVAGTGESGRSSEGVPARTSTLNDPRAIVATSDGGLYILERGGHSLRFVDAAGSIRTVAGTGKSGPAVDGGPALAATLNGPKHLCLDRDGTVLIADAENNVVRRFHPKEGRITRVIGTGKQGAAGIGGDPLACELARPHGVTIGPDGLLYVTDSYNDRVLRIVP